jgi:hypothetical protein
MFLISYRTLLLGLVAGAAVAADPKPAPKPAGEEEQVLKALVEARKNYHKALAASYEHYRNLGDAEHTKWAEEELRAFHLIPKPCYRLDIMDNPQVDPANQKNLKEANELFKLATEYKGKGYGNDYLLNQKRAEIVLQEILIRHPNSDKIADVAYELGDLYEGRAFKQYERAAAYYERSTLWKKGTVSDAHLRAARLYDKVLNERTKAIETYREVIAQDTDPTRVKEAQKRLADLTGLRK